MPTQATWTPPRPPPALPAAATLTLEERANALSHALGCALAIVAIPLLVAAVDAERQPELHWGVSAFVATMVLTYLVSAFYHATPPGAARRWMRRMDHASIFLFIAGSFTPFAIQGCQDAAQWRVLAAVWLTALLGAGLKLANRLQQPLVSTFMYIAFGWMVGLSGGPLLAGVPPSAIYLLMVGGIAYTCGCVFYLLGYRREFSHLVWHIFVIAGTAFHVGAVRTIVVSAQIL